MLLAFSCRKVSSMWSAVQENDTSAPGYWKACSEEARETEELKGFRSTLVMSTAQMYSQIWAFLVFAGTAMHLPSYPLMRNFFSQLHGSQSCYSVFTAICIPKTWCFIQQHLLSVIAATWAFGHWTERSHWVLVSKRLIVWFSDNCLEKEMASPF